MKHVDGPGSPGELLIEGEKYNVRRVYTPPRVFQPGDKIGLMSRTRFEWTLLDFLLCHPGQALTRQQILDAVWSYDTDVLTTQVDVYIVYLRRKLHQPGRPDPIETVRGVGYRLRSPDV